MAKGVVTIKQENIKDIVSIGTPIYYDNIYECYKLASIINLIKLDKIGIVIKILNPHTCLVKYTEGNIIFGNRLENVRLPENTLNITLSNPGQFAPSEPSGLSIGYKTKNGFYFKITDRVIKIDAPNPVIKTSEPIITVEHTDIELFEYCFINYNPKNIWTKISESITSWDESNLPPLNTWICDHFNPERDLKRLHKICRYYSITKLENILPVSDANCEICK